LGNQEINQTRLMPHIAQNFRAAKEVLDARLGRILMQETPLYSDHLGLAGRVDLIAEFDGRLSIIDFKTSAKVKKAEDITSYFIQEAAYAIMCEERTGIPVANLVTILMVDYRKEALVFRERRDSWTSELFSVIQEYSAQVV
jgi:genome maintenance exonuclease 1